VKPKPAYEELKNRAAEIESEAADTPLLPKISAEDDGITGGGGV
jgi:hypothetical protein